MRLVLVAALVLSSASFAQNTSGWEKRVPKTEIKFGEGDVIDGDLKTPEGTIFYGRDRTKFDNMIRVRMSFSDKLMQSVNELR